MMAAMAKPESATSSGSDAPAKPPTKPDSKADPDAAKASKARPREIGGPSGLEPTRYGDWERNGRVSDF
jgi:hypothetical protein